MPQAKELIREGRTFSSETGIRTHVIVARLMQLEHLVSETIPYETINMARRVMEEMPEVDRSRQVLMDSATGAGIYMHRFRPIAPWRFEGAEQSHENCRFDLVYRHPDHGVLIDEIKCGTSRHDEAVIRPQIDKYVDVGGRVWGDEFLGVRVCALHNPARSKLHTPASRRADWLTDSPLNKQSPIR